MEQFDLQRLVLTLPGILIGLTLHEFMHAYVADKCGDDTAREHGRITFNPLKHIDPIGILFIIFAGFGWAKPVSFNEEKLRNPKRDTMLIAVAGPFANVVIAIVTSAVFVALINSHPSPESESTTLLLNCLLNCIFINWGLFVFNMIPIPPLDGSHLIFHTVRHRPELYQKIYRYGTLALFGILLIESRTNITILPIGYAVNFLGEGVLKFFGYGM
ncbi:MAG TPA: site-2 protease family protein [Bacteroidota bacterium]|nr:site-2 protease family protein [Bacteroidota bacterium]